MLKPKISERLQNDLSNNQIKKLDKMELENRRKDSIFNNLFFGEKYQIAFIASLIRFNNAPIRAFLDRCERIEEKHPDWTLSQIVKAAEFGKGTGPKPKYELRPEKTKNLKSKWGKLS